MINLIAKKTSSHEKADIISKLVIESLYEELLLYPKAGLVSLIDNGSHKDMNYKTFEKSINALKSYYKEITLAGVRQMSFLKLKEHGLEAERKMFMATGGINTHKGLIFSLGLLGATAGVLLGLNKPLTKGNIQYIIKSRWRLAILEEVKISKLKSGASHGEKMLYYYAAGGARKEAYLGFPHIFDYALPTLYETAKKTKDKRKALLQTFYVLVSKLEDTNLLYRGSRGGLLIAQKAAKDFLNLGGVYNKAWELEAIKMHKMFITLNLSPGGSADLLAASWFIFRLQTELK